MIADPEPHQGLTVQTVIERWPGTTAVFLRRRMACVGCDLAPFMTIAEAAASYGIPAPELESELRNEARGGPSRR
jgi:hybrid cluster-associated redox disulfide protein